MTRTRIFAVIMLAALGGAAHAGPIAPPAGWTLDPQLSARVAGRAGAAASTTDAYRPAASGAVLYATRVERKVTAEKRDAAATAELEELRAALRRQGANARAESSAMRADPAAKLVEASLTWRDTSAGVVDTSRTVVAADAQRLVAVTGQCVLAADAPADLVKACEAALATLDPGIDAAARVPLAIAAAAEPAATTPEPAGSTAAGAVGPAGPAGPAGSAPSPAAPGDGAATASARSAPEPARLDDGSKVAIRLPPPQPSEPDRRPIYLGFGRVVLALLFWWNRRRRERFEAEDAREAGDSADSADSASGGDAAASRRPAKAAEPAGAAGTDADADDLHAAAAAADKEKDA